MTLDDFYKNSIGKNLFREDLLWYKLGLVKQLEKYVAWIEANDNLPKWATKMHNDEHAYVDFSIGSFFSYCGAEFYGADLRVRQFNLLKNKIVYSFDCIYADMHVQPVPDKTIYYVPIYSRYSVNWEIDTKIPRHVHDLIVRISFKRNRELYSPTIVSFPNFELHGVRLDWDVMEYETKDFLLRHSKRQ